MKGDKVILRALEPEDIDYLYELENDCSLWFSGETYTLFSKFTIEQYVLSADKDIYSMKQLRLMIDITEASGPKTIGAIDLFDIDPRHFRAGIGIVIDKKFRNSGYGKSALKVLIEYAFSTLALHQLYCRILNTNMASIRLFTNAGFIITGTRKDWIFMNDLYQDELFLQLIRK